MGATKKVWNALTAMIKLEDKISRQSEAIKGRQQKIEDLTARMIRLEAQLGLFTTAAALAKRLRSQ